VLLLLQQLLLRLLLRLLLLLRILVHLLLVLLQPWLLIELHLATSTAANTNTSCPL
jgi:hypothetical protein